MLRSLRAKRGFPSIQSAICLFSRPLKLIQAYSRPFNPIQGVLEKKECFTFVQLDHSGLFGPIGGPHPPPPHREAGFLKRPQPWARGFEKNFTHFNPSWIELSMR
jgi:hypothetical protein